MLNIKKILSEWTTYKRRIRCLCILYAREFKSRKSTVWAFFQGKRRLIDKRNLNFRKATERVGIFLNRITYRDCIFLIIKLALSHRIVIRCCPILRKKSILSIQSNALEISNLSHFFLHAFILSIRPKSMRHALRQGWHKRFYKSFESTMCILSL